MLYNPADWYWIVDGDETRLWSSATVAYVPADDAALTLWREAGGNPTRVASEAELQQVLRQQYPAGWPIRVIRSLAFRERLSEAKRAEISVAAAVAAAAGQGALLTFVLDQAAGMGTDLDDPRVRAGVQALLDAALIDEDEAAAMLADGTPDER